MVNHWDDSVQYHGAARFIERFRKAFRTCGDLAAPPQSRSLIRDLSDDGADGLQTGLLVLLPSWPNVEFSELGCHLNSESLGQRFR
jgi:hypothetical protein